MPSVSVIITTHNYNQYLPFAIQSVLEQSFPDFELIVVDDGSAEPAQRIVESFANQKIRYIYQENKGPSAARNTGIQNSRGKYLAFLDADDRYLPEKLSLQVSQLESSPEVGCVFGGWQFVTESGDLLADVRPWESCPNIDLNAWIMGLPFVIHGALLRRDAILVAGLFDESLLACEDWDFFLRLASSGSSMQWTNEIVCVYYIHPQNSTRGTQRIQVKTKVLDKFFARPDLGEIDLLTRHEAYSNAWMQIAQAQLMAEEFEAAEKSLETILKLSPHLLAHRPPEILTNFLNWSLEPRVSNPFEFINSLYRHLPPSLADLSRYRRKTLAALHIDRMFFFFQRKDFKQARRHGFQGIFLDSVWLHNRGVIRILSHLFISVFSFQPENF